MLACFVLERDAASVASKGDELTVVSLGVGTKFLAPEVGLADSDGACVRDSHAEVLARRSLLRWLYRQLELCLQAGAGSATQSVLERGETGKCRMRAGHRLHLYTSTAPCGKRMTSREIRVGRV